MRIVLFGDGEWATRSLLRLQADGHALAGLVTRRRPTDRACLECARQLGAPVLQPADVNAEAFVERVAALGADVGLSIAYDQILRRPLLATPRLGCVNFHAGKLPAYRGRNVITWAILNGEPEIGLTAHMMDDGIDTGGILLQRVLPIGWTDTYGDVLRRVVAGMPELVAETVRGVGVGTLVPVPQPAEAGTYVGGRSEGDEWLDWSATSRDLHNKVRGLSRPGPGARTLLGEQVVVIWRAYYDPAWPQYRATPGQVVGRRRDGSAIVKTGDSTLLVHEVGAGAGSAPPAWPIGTRLGLNPGACLVSVLARLAALEEQLSSGRGADAIR